MFSNNWYFHLFIVHDIYTYTGQLKAKLKLEGRLLLFLLAVSLAVACFIKTNLNKKEGEYEFEVKKDNNSAPAINAGSQDSVPDDANVDKCSRYCITADRTDNKTVVGQCFFNCVNLTRSKSDLTYHPVAKYVSDLNEICSYLHRTGTLCGGCMGGYVPPAYSYNMECFKSSHTHHNWLKYMAVAFLPLTVFMIIILVFRVSVLSPKLLALVFAFQNFFCTC